jgi:hypothetical protein
MQKKIKYHLSRRSEVQSSLNFYWERAVQEILTLGKNKDEVKSIVAKAESHPKYK